MPRHKQKNNKGQELSTFHAYLAQSLAQRSHGCSGAFGNAGGVRLGGAARCAEYPDVDDYHLSALTSVDT